MQNQLPDILKDKPGILTISLVGVLIVAFLMTLLV